MVVGDVACHEAAIRRLIAEYCHHYDDQRAAEFAALFVETATFTVFGTRHVGRRAIHDHIGTQKPGMAPGQHVTYNSVIDLEADAQTARVRTDFLYMTKTADGFAITTAGRYHDRLVLEGDTWRFQARTIVFVGDTVPEGRNKKPAKEAVDNDPI